MCFYTFLGPETSQETLKKPKSRKNAKNVAKKTVQKSDKKIQKKCLRGKKCLKPAISFLTLSGPNFPTQICTLFLTFLHIFFYHFLEKCWNSFWNPVWDQIGQRGGKMSPREPSGASKSQSVAFSKTLKNH